MCSGSWPGLKWNTPSTQKVGLFKPLSFVDFAVVDSDTNAKNNLQCNWCENIMDSQALAEHMDENHLHVVEIDL
uniref:C2H2-type domain-containing protein n=1 Tax=Strongyloides papillosus TaxID=174720 RepID=A0A0N5BGY9_STREA